MKSLLPLLTRFGPLAVLAATAPLASAGQILVPQHHQVLQDAINAALPNDEILVDGGVHAPVVIDKPLSITGVPGNTPLLRPTNPSEFVCPVHPCTSHSADPPIRLSGAGAGTVVLTGLQVAGTVDNSFFNDGNPVYSSPNPSAIEGGGFDELHIIDCTVSAPASVNLAPELIEANHGLNVSIAELIVTGSTITGGTYANESPWGHDWLWSAGHAINTTGNVTICGSTVRGGNAAPIQPATTATCSQYLIWWGNDVGVGGTGVATPGTVTHANSTIQGGDGAVMSAWSTPSFTCPKPDGVAFAAGSVIQDSSACAPTPIPSPCNGVTGPIKISTFRIWGTPNGTDWWWYLDNGGTPMPAVQVPGVSGDYNLDGFVDERDVADAFVDAINAYATANSWPDLSASTYSLFGSTYLNVSSRCQPSLLVSSDGISFCDTSLLGACPFNPQIQLMPLPGWDCNENGIDDELDLASGLSQDTDSNGILDECEANAWTNQGSALAGVNGDPLLVGTGTLAPGSSNTIELSNAAANAPAWLLLATSSTPVPFMGGTLKAYPYIGQPMTLMTSPTGQIPLAFSAGTGMPPGLELWAQWVIRDPAAIQGWAMSNAIRGVTP